ncbi:MAG: hypothetical protein EOO38_01265 [Cytophagaceae bacterium]|nr:MAG: hypothetical protein EOO38_01265 [Cytophagaceae bacterium]
MADDHNLFRKQADTERAIAETSRLPNVRERSLRAAERWDQLADLAEKGKAAAIERDKKRDAV